MSLDPPLDRALLPLARDAGRAALFVDFDGSLATIVDDPAAAVPLPESVRALEALAPRLARVAVVTGRPVDFVRRHLAHPEIVVVGQYGLERDEAGTVVVDPRAAPYQEGVASAADEAERRWPELIVERKGRIAVTLHWRTAPHAAPSADALATLAAAHGLEPVPGRMACELRPPVPVDKGSAVGGLLGAREYRVAAFAGDDHGDLSAFARLGAWAAEGADRRVVRIAVDSPESPPELRAGAELVLDGPPALAAQLGALAAALR